MSLIFMDGFDHYATADITKKWTSAANSSYWFVNPTGGRRGGGCLEIGGSASWTDTCNKTLPAGYSTIVVGMALYVANLTDGLITLKEDNINHFSISLNGIGQFMARRGAPIYGTLLGTTTTSISTGTWYYIELKVTIADATGSYELRVNGVNVLSATNVDTRDGGTGVVNSIQLNATRNGKIDDFYVCNSSGSTNNDFLGDCRIDTILPSGDGTYTDGTPSTGTAHYAVVDENPPNTSDYISMDVVDNRDSYTYPDLPPLSASTVYAVQVNPFWLKDDAGTRSAATFALNGGGNVTGATVALTTSALFSPQIYETNPDTSTAWTQATVNSAEFGTRVIA
jgi:hypothetical protein